jgi:hypothetical protein
MRYTYVNKLTHKDGNKLGRRKMELRVQRVLSKVVGEL